METKTSNSPSIAPRARDLEGDEDRPVPSVRPPKGETHDAVVVDDGTRLFVRRRDADHVAASTSPSPSDPPLRAYFCDGILCDGFVWKYLWDELAAIMPVAHFNYRGHGRSSAPGDPERIDIPAHADDLAAVRTFVAGRADAPALLVGHSMGVQVALEHLRRHPKGVRGLVLICGTFGRVTSTWRGLPVLDLVLPKLLDVAAKNPSLAQAIWSRIPPEAALQVALRMGDLDPTRILRGDVLPYLEHLTNVDVGLFLRMLRAAGEHTSADMLADVKVPVFVVAGERDTFTPPFLAKLMAEAIPGAELYVAPEGTHVASLEQHAAIDPLILDFVRRRVL